MSLLVITQKVDRTDPVLGFFHGWLEAFAKNEDRITVVCLQKGDFSLPNNVKVLSLGKEAGQSRAKYLCRFYKYIWQERGNYSAVFVHMNQEYVLLAGWWWRLAGKKVFLWRNHPKGSFLTSLAVAFANKVFCTSPKSFTARFAKTEIMPVGIDTEKFAPCAEVRRRPRSVLALGRLSPIKSLEILVGALVEIKNRGEDFSATIVGSPATSEDITYEKELRLLARPLVDSSLLSFSPAVCPDQAPGAYLSHEIFVNLTPSGSLDKTILEAMSCGSLVIVRNDFFAEKLGKGFVVKGDDPRSLAEAITSAWNLPPEMKLAASRSNRAIVEREHGLTILVQRLCRHF